MLKSSSEITNLINQYLEKIRNRPDHQFLPVERIAIYRSIGPTNQLAERPTLLEQVEKQKNYDLSQADLTIGWLAIITARKVLPIWELFMLGYNKTISEFESFNAVEMLKLAEDVLLKRADVDKAFHEGLCGKFYFGMMQLEYETTEDVFWALDASYNALGLIISGWKDDDYSKYKNISELKYDVAGVALKAYASKDENEPGKWADVGYYHLEPQDGYKPVKIDPQKELEFWEWWLTEAIPQAWELAQ